MKIKKMSARFGALDGSLTLSGGLNILTAPNESGKSTWCAFLRAMLYGVRTSQRARQGQQPDRIRYRPWTGAPMEGSMDLETPDGAVTLRRWTERDDRPMQAFSAVYTGTELPVPGLTGADAGETLTGMPLSVFERSVFIGQAGSEVTGDPELERRLAAIVASGDEELSFSDAEKRLKAWQRRRSGRRGAIPELEASLAETRRALDSVRADREEAAAAEEELAALDALCAEKDTAMRAARARLRRQALEELGAARREVQSAEARQAEADAALTEAADALETGPFGDASPDEARGRAEEARAGAEELRRYAEATPPASLSAAPLAAALLAFLAAWLLPGHPVLWIAGGALCLAALAAFLGLRARGRAGQDALRRRAELLSACGADDPAELDGLLADHDARWRARESAARALDGADGTLRRARAAQRAAEERTMDSLDFVAGDNEAAILARELEDLRARIGALRERRAMAEGRARAVGDPFALESELLEGERRLEELRRQEEALALALSCLTDADAELQQRLSPLLARRAAAYFSELTGGRYDELTLARDLSARARPAGEELGRDLGSLSAGTKDQLYLALRLAVCDLALPEDDPCPLVLDDALVFFDAERMALALRLLRRIAEKRQVLLFTCHDREAAFFADDPDVRKIDVGEKGETG